MSNPAIPVSLPFPILVGDIGGTNARFGLLETPDAELRVFANAHTADHPDPASAIIAHVFATSEVRPRSIVFALAGPITGDRIKMTNCPWVFEPRALIEALDLDAVVLVNDFEAQALALPSLEAADLQQIGGGTMHPDAPKVVIGPGTGLGVGILAHAAGMWIPLPGEGGHVSLAPETPRDFAIWPHITPIEGRISAESMVSGPGILNLYRALAATDGAVADHASPADVTAAAVAGDPRAIETLDLFARHLGSLAGDFALTALARGGVFLAGGVSQKIAPALTNGTFRAAFEAKAPHRHLCESIPTYLITHSGPALLGLAAYARRPGDYGVDLKGRFWSRT